MSIKRTYLNRVFENSLGLVGGFASLAILQACTTTDIYSVAYAPKNAYLSNTSQLHTGTAEHKSYVARDAAYNRRVTPQTTDYAFAYAAKNDEGVTVPAFDYSKMNSKYLRQQVRYFGPEPAGTIVVDARRRLLYFVQPGGLAMRYGIAVGKEGYGWTGSSVLQWKQKWPTWTPPAEMIERKPSLAKYAKGLEGSPRNPLGARAMYLFKNGRDTLYRIHGTDKPYSIGKAASSGCFRMINQDVMDLYSRVTNKSAVMVREQLAAEFTP